MKKYCPFLEFRSTIITGVCTGIMITILLLAFSVTDGFGQCNLISNPGFESGNTGFTSDYRYAYDANGNNLCSPNPPLWCENTYMVGYDANTYHPSFNGTPRTGSYQMMVNGSSTAYSWKIVYEPSIISVSTGVNYTFSIYCREIYNNSPDPVLYLYINDVYINSLSFGGGWTLLTGTWNSGSSYTADIKIREYGPGTGNDYALDDASFTGPADVTGPTHDAVSVNDNCWITNGTNTYTITLTSTESQSGFGGTYGIMALINLNLGEPLSGGYFSWHPTKYVFDLNQMACSGGGYVSKYSGYGGSRIDLVSASTSISGNQRTVVFTVRPHSDFIELIGTNNIAMYVTDNCDNSIGWTYHNVNFTTMKVPSAPTGATTICCGGSATLTRGNDPPAGATYYWQTSPTGTSTTIGSGATLAASPASTTTYYVRPYSSSGCWGQASTGVTVTVNALPAPQAIGNITVGPVCTANGPALLPDANITASTCYPGNPTSCNLTGGDNHESWRGRLFNSGAGVQAWASTSPFTGSWWQVDLGSVKPVNGVVTQIRGDCCPNQRVASYNVQYSTDGTTWYAVAGGPFTGNITAGDYTVVTNMFSVAYLARYVRIFPLSWGDHCSMRADVISIPWCTNDVTACAELATVNSPTCATVIRWYDAPAGGNFLGSGQYITRTISSNTTIYAESVNGSAVSSSRTAVTLKVNALSVPVIYANGPTTFCQGGSVNLNVRAGTALSLNGTSNYAITPNLTSFFPAISMTVELWFKANAAGVILDELGTTTVNGSWHDSQIEIISTGQVLVRVWALTAVSVGTVSFGSWNHVVVRYDATVSKLDGFLNGVVSSTSVTGSRSAPQNNGVNQYWAIGSTDVTHMGSGAWFNGQVDEMRIWNTARTNAQITAAWNKTVPASSANLIAYYKMDEASGAVLADASGHGNTASLVSSPAWVNPSTAPINYYTAYLWSPGGATTPTISATSTANYTVIVTDANGCTASASTIVSVNPLPTFSVTKTNVSCFGGSDGSITVSIITGTTPYEYSSDNGLSYTAQTSSTTHPFNGLNVAGSPYLIRVRDGNTCVSLQTCP